MVSANRSEGLRRGLEVLGIFKEPSPEWGVSEIARKFGLHKNQVHRTVKTLVDAGFLQKNSETSKYSLGFRAFELGVEAARRINLLPDARPILEKLASDLHATVSIRMEAGDEMVIVEEMENPGRLKVYSVQGNRRSWNFVGSGAKVFTAYWDPERVERLFRKFGLTRHTQNSIVRKSDMFKEIERIRKQGYAVSNGEHSPEILGVSAPILNAEGELSAVLVAAMPSAGISKSRHGEIAKKIVRCSKKISKLVKMNSVSNGSKTEKAGVSRNS